MQTKRITITTPTATGNQAYTGVGFQPVLVLFIAPARASGNSPFNGDSAQAGVMLGATDGTNQGCCTGTSADSGAGSTVTAQRSTSNVILQRSAAGAVQVGASIVSLDSDGFTLSYGTVAASPNQRTVDCICIGGSDVSAFVGNGQSPAATGNKAFTGVGFQPNALILFDALLGSALAAAATSTFYRPAFGFCDGAGNSFSWAGASDDGVNPTNTEFVQSTSACLIGTGTAGGAIDRRATWVSMDSDGFTLNFTTLDATVGVSSRFLYIALSVPNAFVGNTAQRTTTGTTVVTGTGHTPLAMLFGGAHTVATNNGSNNNWGFLGHATSSAAADQGSSSWADTDNLATSNASDAYTNQKAIRFITAAHASPTTDAQANISATSNDGFTVNWTTVDATARLVGYLSLGTHVLTTSDSGSGSEATSTEAVSHQSTDSGSGSDPSANQTKGTADTSSGSENIGNFSMVLTDSGSGSENVGNKTDVLTDSASGADTSAVSQTYATTDSGAATEASAKVSAATESGAAADSSTETALITTTGGGSGADATVNQTKATSDAGSGADASTALTILQQALDAAAASDAVTTRVVFAAESPQAAESLRDRLLVLIDSAHGLEGLSTRTVEPYVDGNYLTMLVSGRQWGVAMQFQLGSLAVDSEMPFSVLRAPVGHEVVLPFPLRGPFGASWSLPVDIQGPVGSERGLPFHLLDNSIGQFPEGGVAAPVVGFWEPDGAVIE